MSSFLPDFMKPDTTQRILLARGNSSGLWFVVLGGVLLLVLGVSLALGSYPISVQTLLAWVVGQADLTAAQILSEVRAPRVFLALLVGSSLGMTGPLLQAGFRTSLADSYLLGLAGFAALGAVLLQQIGMAGFGTPVLASMGAGFAVWLLTQLSFERSSERRALIGVALAAMSLAGLALLLALSQSPTSANVLGWVVGGFYALGTTQLWLMLPFAAFGMGLSLLLGRTANLLQLGDDVSENLGLNAKTSRNLVLMLAALLTGVAVGTSGLMGFVGLLSVSLARALFGTDYRKLLPASALIGGIAVSLADVLGRTLLAPNEIPAGAFTTVLGGIWLMVLSRRAS